MYFVKEYLIKDLSFTSPDNPTKCLIFDDIDIVKTGRTIEGISKIHNHVSNSFYFGFKLLVAGYWNGSIFIPVDFSFHRESRNSKQKYGLTGKQRKKQKSIFRYKRTKAYKRYAELNGVRLSNNKSTKEMRDRGFIFLKQAVDIIRETGQFVFWKMKKKPGIMPVLIIGNNPENKKAK